MHDAGLTVEYSPQALKDTFARLLGGTPRIYQAPGRVNLIGEHTDYNDGFVMPAAVGFYTWAAAAPRNDGRLVVHSENFGERAEVLLDNLPAKGRNHWSDYIVGVAKMLAENGVRLPGANVLLQGSVPQGAGLSSSASLEVAVCSALLGRAGHEMDMKDVALLCQRAENEFVGARCGIMDQFVSSHGRRDHALLLDCR